MEILFVLILGLLILGPKQMHTILAHMARAKAELENATRGLKSQLAAEIEAARGPARPTALTYWLGTVTFVQLSNLNRSLGSLRKTS